MQKVLRHGPLGSGCLAWWRRQIDSYKCSVIDTEENTSVLRRWMKGVLHDCVTKDFMEEVIPSQGLKNMSRNLYQANKDEGREN